MVMAVYAHAGNNLLFLLEPDRLMVPVSSKFALGSISMAPKAGLFETDVSELK
jgi:hypothetical protein